MTVSPRKPHEQEILDFILSRARFTYPEVIKHCDASGWACRTYLKELKREGVVVPFEREGNTQFFKAALPNGQTTVDLPTITPQGDEEQAIWDYIHKRPYFTFEDIAMVCAVGAIRTNFMRHLRKRGIIREWGRNEGKIFYSVKQPEDARTFAKDIRATGEGAIWTAIRHQKKFRPIDLFAALSPARPDIRLDDIIGFCRVLRNAGYLRASARLRSRNLNSETNLLLLKNTGPLPPQQKRMTVVIDNNQDKIVYAPGGRLQ